MSDNNLKVHQITSALEAIAPLSYQESYDNSGLLTGQRDMEVKAALVTLDCTEEVVDEAITRNCNLIVAHHPIIFSGLKNLTGSNYVQRTVIKAIRNDIAIYAMHTNLDNVHHGVNRKLADKLGLSSQTILSPKSGILKKLVTFVPTAHIEAVKSAIFEAGAGQIGNYDQCSFEVHGEGGFRGNEGSNPFVGEKGSQHKEAETRLEAIMPSYLEGRVVAALRQSHPYEEPAFDIHELANANPRVGSGMLGNLDTPLSHEEFLTHVKDKMNLKSIRYTKTRSGKISKVAVCGGAGSFLLKQALAAGADAFVTSDFKYHEFFDAENRLMIADIGHYESEIYTKELLKELIVEKFPTFAVLLSEFNTNPVNYF